MESLQGLVALTVISFIFSVMIVFLVLTRFMVAPWTPGTRGRGRRRGIRTRGRGRRIGRGRIGTRGRRGRGGIGTRRGGRIREGAEGAEGTERYWWRVWTRAWRRVRTRAWRRARRRTWVIREWTARVTEEWNTRSEWAARTEGVAKFTRRSTGIIRSTERIRPGTETWETGHFSF